MFSGVFKVEEVGGVGNIGSEDTTAIHVLVLLEAFFEIVLEICLFD